MSANITTKREHGETSASDSCDVVFRTKLSKPFARILQHVGRRSENEAHVIGDTERLAGNAEQVLFLH